MAPNTRNSRQKRRRTEDTGTLFDKVVNGVHELLDETLNKDGPSSSYVFSSRAVLSIMMTNTSTADVYRIYLHFEKNSIYQGNWKPISEIG